MFGISLRRVAVLEDLGGIAKISKCQETKLLKVLCLSSLCIGTCASLTVCWRFVNFAVMSANHEWLDHSEKWGITPSPYWVTMTCPSFSLKSGFSPSLHLHWYSPLSCAMTTLLDGFPERQNADFHMGIKWTCVQNIWYSSISEGTRQKLQPVQRESEE